MTRPGGTTPHRGLPYPGSANIQAQTPNALQALAEAITTQLGGIGAGMIFDTFTGTVSVNQVFTMPAFPNLQSVTGAVVNYGNFAGGMYRTGFMNFAAGTSGWTSTTFSKDAVMSGTISVCILAWGPAK